MSGDQKNLNNNFSQSLLNWYFFNKREFPWRTEVYTHKHLWVYHTWICEVMSQQTLISVVLPKFQQFISHLPDLESLANCSEELLRFLWSGLGYYARARNLQKGAHYILSHHKGEFPTSQKEWLNVPGCGEYTSSIIASICFSEVVPAVDGNMIRVGSRLLGMQNQVWEKSGQEKIKKFMLQIMQDYFKSISHRNSIESDQNKNKVTSGDFNQAIMDLGSMVCKKSNPLCEECPLKNNCVAYENQIVSLCPPVKPRKESQEEHVVALVMKDKNKESYLLVEREKGFLLKTSGFPLYAQKDGFSLNSILSEVKKVFSHVQVFEKKFSHSITHHKITGSVILFESNGAELNHSEFLEKMKFPLNKNWISHSNLKKQLSSSLDLKVFKTLSEVF